MLAEHKNLATFVCTDPSIHILGVSHANVIYQMDKIVIAYTKFDFFIILMSLKPGQY